MTWTDLYPAAAGELLEAVDAGPVVVTGLPGSGRADLVREVLAGRHVVELDALAAATGDGLRQDATRAVIRAFAGDGAGRELKLAVARTFGPDAPDALAVAQGKTGVAWPTAAIFEALPSEVALLVHDAHLLHAPWAARSLWALRARMQSPDRPGLVLLTRPWHSQVLTGVDGPFFGFATAFDLPIPTAEEWAAATGGENEIYPPALDWLLEQTRGLPRTTLAVLDLAPPSDWEQRQLEELQRAWRGHLRSAREAATAVRQLVRGVHQLAPRLLHAIASGARVYRSVPGARTDSIAAALRAMRDHDVIYQPRPRQWAIADPALVPHLASADAYEVPQELR